MLKQHATRGYRILSIILIMLILLTAVSAVFVSAASGAKEAPVPKYKSLEELRGKRIGMQVGTVFDEFLKESIPDVKIEYFNTFPDEINALKAHKIDGVATLDIVINQLLQEDDSLAVVDGTIGAVPLGFVYPKNEKGRLLADQMSEFLTNMKESGELDRLTEVWNGSDESAKIIPDYISFPAENGTLLGFIMYLWCRKGGRLADTVTRFCVWLVQGMPGIVLLMLLYYVIFGKSNISGMWVAVIGFTMIFAASFYGMLLSGVKAVDQGQHGVGQLVEFLV